MKTLVVYYSHSGNTKQVAEEIAKNSGADIEAIAPAQAIKGVFGYIAAAAAAWRKRPSDIQPVKYDPSAYDLIIIGTPVWAWSLAPAVRRYLELYGGRLRRVAFFCTQGGSGAEGVFKQMAELCGKQPEATLIVNEQELKQAEHTAKARAFIQALPAYA